ncbi:MAG: hypothetical protein ACOX3A_10800 [bacterium]
MVIIWLVMAAIAIREIPPLLAQGKRGELLTFIILWLSATLYASLVLGDAAIPNPIGLIIAFLGD